MREAGRGVAGAMAALLAGPDDVERLIRDVPGVQAANWNGPRQTVIAGPSEAVKQALDLAASRGMQGRILPVSSAFHTPLVAAAREPLARLAASCCDQSPDRPVYSNLDAAPHPADPTAIAARLGDHLAGPVRFADMIEAMHRDGARVFVEVGPGSILTPLVEAILKDRPHLAVACDAPGSSGLAGWLRAVARLVVGRRAAPARTAHPRPVAARARSAASAGWSKTRSPPTPSTWLVNGSRARPFGEPEPTRLGQALAALCLNPSRSRERPSLPNGSHAARHHQRRSREPAARASPSCARRADERNRCSDVSALPLGTKRQSQIHIHAMKTSSATIELGRSGHRVVPADHAGVPRSAEVDDARVPGRAGRAAARPSRRFSGPRRERSRYGARRRSAPRRRESERQGPSAIRAERPPGRIMRAGPSSRSATRRTPERTATETHGDDRIALGRAPRRHRIARRSPPGCSRPSAIGPATRSRPWGSTSIWKPTWESTRSSGSRSWESCAMNSRA